jgi:hypothetical protein
MLDGLFASPDGKASGSCSLKIFNSAWFERTWGGGWTMSVSRLGARKDRDTAVCA